MAKWKTVGGLSNNEVLSGNGFYVSYMRPGGSSFASFFSSDDGRAETALCIDDKKGSTEFFILNGDFRKEYEKAAPKGLKACLAVFKKHEAKHKSSWSK